MNDFHKTILFWIAVYIILIILGKLVYATFAPPPEPVYVTRTIFENITPVLR